MLDVKTAGDKLLHMMKLPADRSRVTGVVAPVSSSIVVRLYKSILYMNTGKCPRSLWRLMTTMCMYGDVRRGLLKAIFSGLTIDIRGATR